MNDSQIKTYAGFWQRVRAFALDYIIILLYLAVLTLLSLLINRLFGLNEWLFADRVRAQITGFFSLLYLSRFILHLVNLRRNKPPGGRSAGD